MKHLVLALSVFAFVFGATLYGSFSGEERSPDEPRVRAAVLDYALGLYEGEPERVERSVHPELTKIGFYRRPDAAEFGAPSPMTRAQLVDLAERGVATPPEGSPPPAIEVYDVLDVTACVKLTAFWGTDYMLLAKEDGKWTIRQILWQSHPPGTESTENAEEAR